jgi:hypothetical protein
MTVFVARLMRAYWGVTAALLAAALPGRASFSTLGGAPRRAWVRVPRLVREREREGQWERGLPNGGRAP